MQPDNLADDVISVIDGAVTPLLERQAAADVRIADLERRLSDALALTTDLASVRERLAVVEQTTLPGPAGPAGPPGPAGAAGVGFDDLTMDYDGERTLTLTFRRGDQFKVFPIVVPWPLYRGPYTAGADFVRGDVVTSGGSAWHAGEPTRQRPGEHPSWRLMVQRGKAGRNADRDREGVRA